jgi:16S rRNA C1402 (ribose-2'-O) methylase RsmI
LLLAMAASGLNGQNFAFVGYIPNTPTERAQRIRELESLALKSGQTQLFIENALPQCRCTSGLAANPAACDAAGNGQQLDTGQRTVPQ